LLHPIITVIGKAFWDVGDARKHQSNRRKRLPQYSVWEIHHGQVLVSGGYFDEGGALARAQLYRSAPQAFDIQ
jgi:hypothetical protein